MATVPTCPGMTLRNRKRGQANYDSLLQVLDNDSYVIIAGYFDHTQTSSFHL